MTPRQLELARHALGLPNRWRCSYRNYFVAGPGGQDHEEWLVLVGAGFARQRSGSVRTGGNDLFWLTRAGAEVALKRGERLDLEDFPGDLS